MDSSDSKQRPRKQVLASLEEVASRLTSADRSGRRLTGGNTWLDANAERLRTYGQECEADLLRAQRELTELRALHESGRLTGEARSRSLEVLTLVVEAAKGMREHLLAAELGERFSDPTGGRAEDALADWGLPGDSEHRKALDHVLTRPPRGSTVQGWRRAMRRSSQVGSYRWLRSSVSGAVRDARQRGTGFRLDPAPEPGEGEIEVLALVDRLAAKADLSLRQAEVLRAQLVREAPKATADRLQIARTTVHTHRRRALEKLREASKKGALDL